MTMRTATRQACLVCQRRSITLPTRRLSTDKSSPSWSKEAPATEAPHAIVNSSPLAYAPRAYGKNLDDFTPTPLSRPIGLNYPPFPGENTGIDHRSLRQRRDEFVDYQKHLVRREQLKSEISRPYFREWTNLKFHKGKTFIAPPRLFKADVSLFFPNLHGRTLSKSGPAAATTDTTPALVGRASVVSIFSGQWAEKQAGSFVCEKANPMLHEVLRESGGRAQLVQVNIEQEALKWWLLRLFTGSLRRHVGEEYLDRYFLIRRGISDEIRECIGLLNSKVGYVYLVDHECRIRWAGSAVAEDHERQGLVKGVQRLLEEMKRQGITDAYERQTVPAEVRSA